jgi:hypothetical protein
MLGGVLPGAEVDFEIIRAIKFLCYDGVREREQGGGVPGADSGRGRRAPVRHRRGAVQGEPKRDRARTSGGDAERALQPCRQPPAAAGWVFGAPSAAAPGRLRIARAPWPRLLLASQPRPGAETSPVGPSFSRPAPHSFLPSCSRSALGSSLASTTWPRGRTVWSASTRESAAPWRSGCVPACVSPYENAKMGVARRVGLHLTLHARAQCPPFIPSQITGPSEQPEFQQEDSASGKFAFTASEGGSHKVRA